MKKVVLLFLTFICSFALFVTPSFADNVYFTSSPTFVVNAGSIYSYQISAKSISNYSVSFSFKNLPSWLSFNSSNNVLSGSTTNTGRYTIDIFVSDNHGSNEEQAYYLTVVHVVTSTPTNTPVSPSTTPVPTTSLSPTKATTPTPSPAPQNNGKISLTDIFPGGGSTITTGNINISGLLSTPFQLNNKNISFFFDNSNVSSKTQLSEKAITGGFQTKFTYAAQNLQNGSHNFYLLITTPNQIAVPQSWDFTVKQPTPKAVSLFNQIKPYLFSQKTGFIVLGIALLIFILIVVKLIRQRKRIPNNA